MRRNITDLDMISKRLMEQIEELDGTRETKKVVEAISERLDGFANIEHVHQLKTIFLPKIKIFS